MVLGSKPVAGMSLVMLMLWVVIDAPLWHPEQVWPLLAGYPDLPPEGPLELVRAGRLAMASRARA